MGTSSTHSTYSTNMYQPVSWLVASSHAHAVGGSLPNLQRSIHYHDRSDACQATVVVAVVTVVLQGADIKENDSRSPESHSSADCVACHLEGMNKEKTSKAEGETNPTWSCSMLGGM